MGPLREATDPDAPGRSADRADLRDLAGLADLEWAASGAMALTGAPDGPPALAPGRPTLAMRGALAALRAVAARLRPGCERALADLDAPALLGERAALAGLARGGTVAPGGRARLVRGADGWLAVNLARPDDVDLLPAWLEAPLGADPWQALQRVARSRRVGALVARGRAMGMPVAPCAAPPRHAPAWCRGTALRTPRPPDEGAMPRVLDLSSLWAGPLATSLLERLGARVVKVESVSRPDGARAGSPDFFDLLNAGKASIAVELGAPEGRDRLRSLLGWADIVVESARPRALTQLGFDAAAWVTAAPGRTWLSITGYGRALPWGHWVAFGDDAAAAAGWCRAPEPGAPPRYCGDALADPLTGIHAAAAALADFRRGGGRLLDLSLRDVAAAVLASTATVESGRGSADVARVEPDGSGWLVVCGTRAAPVRPPRARTVAARAARLGRDDGWDPSREAAPC